MAQDVTPAVLAALPSLPERKLQALLNQLSVIGVESEGDLQLVREADLHHILTPLQCRRLLDAWRGDDEYVSLGGADPATAEDRASSPAPPAHSPPGGPGPDGSTLGPSSWPDSFVVPWTRMPACVTAAVALNDRPTPKSRREMVRIVVDEMRLRDLNPTRADCVAVAKRMVREYPDSFADVLSDGTTRVGSGYGSLVAQIKTRVEHVNRGNALARHRKPKRPSAAAAAAEEAARGPDDRYGCVRRQPGRPPHHASDEPLRRKQQQQEMKEPFGADEGPGAGPTQRGRVGPLTEETYPLQRRAIDDRPPPPSVVDPRTAWPRLFTPRGLYDHFQRLTGVAVLERMERALAEKGRLIVEFFERKPVGTDTARVQALLRRFGSGEGSAVGPCAVLLLMAHLNEEVEALILEADVLATAAEAERALELPASPRLIVLGDVLTAGRWMLSMEGRVVVPAHPDFVAGLAALFSAYYAFNLAYQEGASCTLEFIQRCFLGLNPPLGTKAPSSKNKSDVRVSTFLRRLIDFDWLFV